MASSLDFLFQKPEDAIKYETDVKLNEGGSNFAGGMIGYWSMGTLWKVQAAKSTSMEGIEYDGVSHPSWADIYYFNNKHYEQAKNAATRVNEVEKKDFKFGPEQNWHFQMPLSSFVNYRGKEPVDQKFKSDPFEFDVPIVGFRSKKYYHFHLLMLPSMIQELAILQGTLKERVYEYARLPSYVKEGDPNPIDDTFQERVMGFDNKPWESELGKARAAIWQAVGESNPKAYVTNSEQAEIKVTSIQLQALLGVVYRPNMSMWAQMNKVLDPRSGALNKDSEQLQVWVCSKVYKTEEDARADAGVEVASDGMPPLPQAWAGMPAADFVDSLKTFIKDQKMSNLSVADMEEKFPTMLKALKQNLAATPAEVIPWLAHLD